MSKRNKSRAQGPVLVLVHDKTGEPAKVGDTVTDRRTGDTGTILNWDRPRGFPSTGSVVVRMGTYNRSIPASLLGLAWSQTEVMP